MAGVSTFNLIPRDKSVWQVQTVLQTQAASVAFYWLCSCFPKQQEFYPVTAACSCSFSAPKFVLGSSLLSCQTDSWWTKLLVCSLHAMGKDCVTSASVLAVWGEQHCNCFECVYVCVWGGMCMCVRAFVYSPLLLLFVTVCANNPFRMQRTHVISVKLLCDRLVWDISPRLFGILASFPKPVSYLFLVYSSSHLIKRNPTCRSHFMRGQFYLGATIILETLKWASA